MARSIWEQHYLPDILTGPELEFFWQRAYTPLALRADMRAGAHYEWISIGGQRVGFLAYRIEADERRLHLGKLYLEPAWQGWGVGMKALSRILVIASRAGLEEIYLYVFRQNQRAVRAYAKAGFVIERTEMTDCGAGFRYDDYVMVCRLPPESRR
jgi:ribosomal protein S18 acetylase RimI-like enzyme